MGDLASDHDAAIELVRDEYRRLQRHDPKHDLLKYLLSVEDDGIAFSTNESVQNEFLTKYAPKENTPTAVMLAKYFVALRDAVDKIEGIDRSPKRGSQPRKIYETHPEKDEPLPF